jgi:hypothetical protein
MITRRGMAFANMELSGTGSRVWLCHGMARRGSGATLSRSLEQDKGCSGLGR